jgi:hypothetical protein
MSQSNLWLPESARDPEPERKELHCHLCGEVWPPERVTDWQGHFQQCIREHQGDIHEMSVERQRHPANWVPDPEVAAHMEKVGKRMIREGRLEVKPSERAGFS